MAGEYGKFSVVWKIENFSMLPHQFNERLESQRFVVDHLDKYDFVLWLYPKGDIGSKNYIGFFLRKVQEDVDLKQDITYTIESTKPSSEIMAKKHVLKRNWGFPQIVSIDKIFKSKQLYLPKDTLTLRCDIVTLLGETSTEVTINNENKTIPTFLKQSCVSRTCIAVQRRSIVWTIRNIDRLIETSITLSSAIKDTPSLKLTMSPHKTSDDFIQILIKQFSLSSKEQLLFVKCKITLTSAHEDYQVFKESTHLFKWDISDVWSFPPFIKASMLTDENYHFQDDILLRCEFAFSSKDSIQHIDDCAMPYTFQKRKKPSKLSTSLENIFGVGKFSDIELKAGGKTFPYYKVLLCARSPVFAAMFDNDMKEKNSNVVEIDDVDADTVQRMLTYMHSDVLEEDLSPEDACRLYTVADKYDIGPLKRTCTVFLMSELSVASVCVILVLADVHQNGLLMTAACQFITGHSNKVFHSKEWNNLMEDHPKLTSTVMHQVLTKKNQL